jgi:SAM-dependent methyltransferase
VELLAAPVGAEDSLAGSADGSAPVALPDHDHEHDELEQRIRQLEDRLDEYVKSIALISPDPSTVDLVIDDGRTESGTYDPFFRFTHRAYGGGSLEELWGKVPSWARIAQGGMSVDQSTNNRFVYERRGVVLEYETAPSDLLPSEQAILAPLRSALRNKRVLDLGVGSGRTTRWLLEHTPHYVGIDYSASMVAACRRRMPGVDVRHFDARRVAEMPDEPFDFIIFSFNGIDSVGDGGRRAILRGALDKLVPGGHFLFSSHNLRFGSQRPWHLGLYDWGPGWRGRLRSGSRLLRNLVNHSLRRHLEESRDGYAIWTDSGHEFRCVHYNVDPGHQVDALVRLGFSDVAAFDMEGVQRAPSSQALQESVHVHYLARRPL